ncbi:response regulator transcription factor [Intrasporangium flavum]|uniref:response regulator transcription factor n=1 Tax=Intrasporangium flavum TaxID=1428657 RepID=UPI00096C5E09|nr:response regulator transcription factor [Intrasporangium flavum]
MSVTAGLRAEGDIVGEIIRVMVVDDHQTVAAAMALAIDMEPGLSCTGSAHSAAEARRQAADHRPDVIVMDVNLGDEDGIELAAELIRQNPCLHVVVLTADMGEGLLRRAAASGAGAFLLKDGRLTELLEAIRNRDGDGLAVQPRVLRDVLRESPPANSHTPLTAREAQVLTLLSEGHNTAAIARHLGITRLTCRGYVKNLLVKLQVHSQLEAVVTARKLGLIGP